MGLHHWGGKCHCALCSLPVRSRSRANVALAQRLRKLHSVQQGHTDALFALAVSPDGRFLFSAAADGKVVQWNLKDGQVSRTCVKWLLASKDVC